MFVINATKAQKQITAEDLKDLPNLIKTLPTLPELIREIEDGTEFHVYDASLDKDPPTIDGKKALPQYDFGYVQDNCCYVAHAHVHTFLGIHYGDVYYISELVGCV